MNHILLGLAERNEVDLELLFSQQWLGSDGKLDPGCPLRDLPQRTFSTLENATERTWKFLGYPSVDKYLPEKTDWLYAPMETYIPVSKCPVAVTLHDIQAFEPDLPWSRTWKHRLFRYKWELWVRRAFSKCRVILTVSEFSKQRMVDLLAADPQKIVVIGNGVEQCFFDIASADLADWQRPVESPYIILIGGLRQKKGGDDVLAVAKALHQRKSHLHIVVAGESETVYVEASQNCSNITLLRMVPDADLLWLLRGASSFLFLSPYEGFGIPALEAMAAGIPTVVSNQASLPEIVGDAGIVVDPKTPDAIADLLIELDNNSYLRKKYIELGRKHAAQYTWSRCVDRLISTFKQFA
ncbi:glycosyltransferase family 4 protein [Nostoc sp.]|uniref:glycosyltransferase family 4 protein n=1 Tax=Nostoc sp. TaxID=1180 RepID=UPI002FF74DA9